MLAIAVAVNSSVAEAGGTTALTRTPAAGFPAAVRTTPVTAPFSAGRFGICNRIAKSKNWSIPVADYTDSHLMTTLLLMLALLFQGIPVQPTQSGTIAGTLRDGAGKPAVDIRVMALP